MTPCQCDLPEQMSWAGPAAQLCQHSNAEAAMEIQVNLAELDAILAQEIPPEKLLSTTLIELSEQYKREVVGEDFNLMTQEEHNVLMLNFLRHVGICIHTLMSTMVLRHAERTKQT